MQHIVLSGVTAECSSNNYCIKGCELFKFTNNVDHDSKKDAVTLDSKNLVVDEQGI